MDEAVERYLARLAEACRRILGPNLLGLYLHGSAAHGDFLKERSDLDLLGVVRVPTSPATVASLVRDLDHARLPVPATGLELTLLTEATARDPAGPASYDFRLSTGSAWTLEWEEKGLASETLIERETCREKGRVLLGPPPDDAFAPVPRDRVLAALLEVVDWHRWWLLDRFHDPRGQYSVLNACRAWLYAETGRLESKSEGGRWVLSREPGNVLVRGALLLRDGRDAPTPDATEIDALLRVVLDRLRAAAGP